MSEAYVLLFVCMGSLALFIAGAIVYIWLIVEKWLRILPTRTERMEKKGKTQYFVYYKEQKQVDEKKLDAEYCDSVTEKTYNELVTGVRYRALFKGHNRILLVRQIDTT